MEFHSSKEIVEYVKSRMSGAIQQTQEQVFQIINRFVKQYYAEYSPEIYERTYQLYRSLVKTEVVPTGNGFEATIYFDAGQLDYQIKSLTKWPVDGGYMNPFNHAISSDGTFNNPHGNAEMALADAAHGSHGGKVSGTAIWDDPMKIIKPEINSILIKNLRAAGIPIR